MARSTDTDTLVRAAGAALAVVTILSLQLCSRPAARTGADVAAPSPDATPRAASSETTAPRPAPPSAPIALADLIDAGFDAAAAAPPITIDAHHPTLPAGFDPARDTPPAPVYLRARVCAPGDPDAPALDADDTVRFHIAMAYRADNDAPWTRFRDTQRDGAPITFDLDNADLPPGLRLAAVGMRPGETRLALVPAHWAYRDIGRAPVPPGADQLFAFQLIEIEDAG